MRKRVAYFLVAILLSCNMNALAVTALGEEAPDISDGVAYGESTATASDTTKVPGSEDSAGSAGEKAEESSGQETDDLTGEDTGSQENGLSDKNAESETEESTEENTDPSLLEAEEETKLEEEEEVYYNVSFPTRIQAYLDPGNISGRGQVFSNEYTIENYGNTDIAIKIKNIEIRCRSERELYEFSEIKATDSNSRIKRMNVSMVWENASEGTEKELDVFGDAPDEYLIQLKAAQYDENGEFVSLTEGGTGLFYFTGTLNPNPDIEWDEQEMVVRFDYEIVDVRKAEEEESAFEEEGTLKTQKNAFKSEENIANIKNEENEEDDTKEGVVDKDIIDEDIIDEDIIDEDILDEDGEDEDDTDEE